MEDAGQIRDCVAADHAAMFAIINDAAAAYKGIIPPDRWHDPYMPEDELRGEIAAGVRFRGFEEAGELIGVMGVQAVADVVLIRHAYVRTYRRNRGIGGRLLSDLLEGQEQPVLVGTWAAADWAVRFYEKHGFQLTTPDQKKWLLATYWDIPLRQIETSVVLADGRWYREQGEGNAVP